MSKSSNELAEMRTESCELLLDWAPRTRALVRLQPGSQPVNSPKTNPPRGVRWALHGKVMTLTHRQLCWTVCRWLAAISILVGSNLPMSAAAAPALGDGWLAGPGTVGDNTYSGVIDAPLAGVLRRYRGVELNQGRLGLQTLAT